MRNFLLHTSVTESSMDSSVASELQVKYNNIRKVDQVWRYQPSSGYGMLIFGSILFAVGLLGAFY